jgi:hypothetical protein
MLSRDGVEDKVETAYMLAHLIGIARNDIAKPKKSFDDDMG